MRSAKPAATLTDRRLLASRGPKFRPHDRERRTAPVALVYRGPASIPG